MEHGGPTEIFNIITTSLQKQQKQRPQQYA